MLIDKLNKIKSNLTTEEEFDLYKNILDVVKPELKDKKYGLVWEERKEDIDLLLENKTPYIKEIKDFRIDNESNNNHIIIEGDNLLGLTALKRSKKKVDVIYIDPPYNTGKEFTYNDEVVNKEDSYRHSKWISFMYKRLKIARDILKEDGVIFISIDDNELYNLKLLMDEIFGEENFIANLVWANKEGGGSSDSKHFRVKHEYVLVFAKNKDKLKIKGDEVSNIERYTEEDDYKDIRGPYYLQKLGMGSIRYSKSLDYPILTPENTEIYPKDNNNGKKACWRWSKEKYKWGLENGYIEFKKRNNVWTVYTKQYLNADNDGNIIERRQRPMGIIDKYSTTQAAKALKHMNMDDAFNYSKPVDLIKYLISKHTKKNAIVLDFFAGSGTTLEATLKLNNIDNGSRQCILMNNNEVNNTQTAKFFNKHYNTDFTITKSGELSKRNLGKYKEFTKTKKYNDVVRTEEFKDIGICRKATYVRSKKVINGYINNMNKKVDGFINNNLYYYEIDFLDNDSDYYAVEKVLIDFSKELIKIRYNAFNELIDEEEFKVLEGSTHQIYIYTGLFITDEVVSKVNSYKSNKEKILYILKENMNELKINNINVDKVYAIPDRFIRWFSM